MSEKPNVIEALSAVMADVQAVKKGDRNQAQNFNFRGIDAVVNAVGPALRKHGVVALPVKVVPAFESYQSRQGALMRNTTLTITWRFYGPGGDHVEAETLGEAADAGDKSVPKAHSVAYRILLLQALCIPTDEPDPDTAAHERAVPAPRQAPDPRLALFGEVKALRVARGWSDADVASDFQAWSEGGSLIDAEYDQLHRYVSHLKEPVG
jgi:hypothetical protein